ncbi:ferredoxin [Planosporangium thailandense]|uniref:Ferredoxin n=1 Tax=Planosporangium thailandense TaxID=765197 RepID=A0ABX0Y2K5_9ACTN|nr:ferredoxin [Planosporangium thailandense]NJC72352.1 ferredoxin [Planosporangium thailandense]
MRVRADRDRCCGSGNCVMTVPDVFDQDDAEGLVLVRLAEVPAALREGVRQAAELCPAAAIEVEEDQA